MQFELVMHRYERKSLLVTSNQAFSEWENVFSTSAMTVAAVDRLVDRLPGGACCTVAPAGASGSTALRCRSWRPSSRPGKCMSSPTVRRSGAWGRVSGSAVSEGVSLPRLLTTLALAIVGAFLLVGGSGKERACPRSQDK